MSWGGKANQSAAGKKLVIAANWVVKIFGAAIFLFLTWYSMRYTQYINPEGPENPVNVRDSMLQNILLALLVSAVLLWMLFLEKRILMKVQKLISKGVLVLTMFWIGTSGFWWIMSAKRIPQGDQAFIYGGASYFLEGDYSFLLPGGYCGMYPHQLALIALMEILFLFAGTYNYFAFQCICVLLAVGIVYFGCQIVQCITGSTGAVLFYCLTMAGCLPLIFYTSWVYGDIPSVFFSLLGAWMLCRYGKTGHWGYMAVVAASLTMSVLVRKNSLIMVVAFCIIAVVWAFFQKDRKIMVTAGLTILLPALIYAGIYKMYEIRSGYEHSDGFPAISWIAMGLQENEGKYGWYNNYPKQVFYDTGCDMAAVDADSKREIRSRLEEFADNPSYAWTFFREKLLSQWNEPFYQAMFFGTQYHQDFRPPEGSFVLKISTEYFVGLLRICDRLQFVLYFGMFLYFLFAVKPRSNLLWHLLAVTMIGGFLFSIIWEAKARYVLPYYIAMFSMSSVGYWQMLTQAMMLFRRKQKEEDNIIEFHRAA